LVSLIQFENKKRIKKGRTNSMTLPLNLIQNFILILFSGYSSKTKETKAE
jgi:hypothetical protein